MSSDTSIDQVESIKAMTRFFAVICSEFYNKIVLAYSGSMSNFFSADWYQQGYRLGLQVAGKNPDKVDEALLKKYQDNLDEMESKSAKYNESYEQQIGGLKAFYQAFLEICQEEQLSAEELIKELNIFEYHIELKKYISMKTVTVEEETVNFYKKVLIEIKNEPGRYKKQIKKSSTAPAVKARQQISRDTTQKIIHEFSTGKYDTKEMCAHQIHEEYNLSYDRVRTILKGEPLPEQAIRRILNDKWKSGKYKTKEICAIRNHKKLKITYENAMLYLDN